MEATLIKRLDNGWPVYSLRRADGKMIATTRFPFDEPALMIAKNAGIELQKLSHENCDEIFGVTDVEKLADERFLGSDDITIYNLRFGFKEGFNKAIELNGDKQFTSRNMLRAYIQGTNDGAQFESLMDYDSEDFDEAHEFAKEAEREFIQSLQQPTEIEVEVEMEKVVDETKVVGAVKGVKGSGDKITTYKSVPKLDAEGCIMLKKAR